MDIEQVKEKIAYCRKNKIGYVFHNLFPETPSWEQIINHLNYEYNNILDNPYQKYIDRGHFEKPEYTQYGEIIKNGVLFYKGKDLYISAIVKKVLNFFPQAEKPLLFFRKVLNDPDANFGQMFINFVSNDNQIAMHIDERETIFWLCQGEVTWLLADPNDWSKITKYNLKAGDVIFVPYGLPHTVETNAPRAGLVFAAFYEDYDRYIESTKND